MQQFAAAATIAGAAWQAWRVSAPRERQAPGPWEEPAAAYLILATPYRAYDEPAPVSGYYPVSNAAYHATRALAEQLGGRAHPHIPLKELAYLSGLAAPGDNTLALVGDWGSRVCLTAIAFNRSLNPVRPPASPACLHCGACRRACPTGALGSGGVDRSRCLSAATLSPGIQPAWLQPLFQGRVHGCDLCQAACPLNGQPQPVPEGIATLFAPERLVFAPDRAAIAAAIGRNLAKPNLLAGLAAMSLAGDAALRALAHPHPPVRAHAARNLVWAGQSEPVRAFVARETDPAVRAAIQEVL